MRRHKCAKSLALKMGQIVRKIDQTVIPMFHVGPTNFLLAFRPTWIQIIAAHIKSPNINAFSVATNYKHSCAIFVITWFRINHFLLLIFFLMPKRGIIFIDNRYKSTLNPISLVIRPYFCGIDLTAYKWGAGKKSNEQLNESIRKCFSAAVVPHQLYGVYNLRSIKWFLIYSNHIQTFRAIIHRPFMSILYTIINMLAIVWIPIFFLISHQLHKRFCKCIVWNERKEKKRKNIFFFSLQTTIIHSRTFDSHISYRCRFIPFHFSRITMDQMHDNT